MVEQAKQKQEKELIHILSFNSYSREYEENGETVIGEVIIDSFLQSPEERAAPPGMVWHLILGKYVPEEDAGKEMWVPIEETVLADDSDDEDSKVITSTPDI